MKTAALLLLPLVPACASIPEGEGAVDRSHAFVGRAIADMIDRVDRRIGATRVEDREVKVKVAASGGVQIFDEGVYETKVHASGRIPLPALERMANLYLDLGSDIDTLNNSAEVPESEEETRRSHQAGIKYLNLLEWPFSYGIALRAKWSEGAPQFIIKPFLRWELRRDPYRFYASEEVFYITEEGFGETTTASADYIFPERGYLRLSTSATVEEDMRGLDLKHSLGFRQPIGETGALSYEAGTVYNTSGEENDEIYFQVQWITPLWRDWLLLEVRPKASRFWRDGNRTEYSVLFGVTVIFEDFLRND